MHHSMNARSISQIGEPAQAQAASVLARNVVLSAFSAMSE
jgi:hypothetical protein